jgi:hypothetical protein
MVNRATPRPGEGLHRWYGRAVADWPDRWQEPPGPGEPPEDPVMPSPGEEPPGAGSHAEEVLRRHGPALLAIDGVEGIAVGRSPTGEDAIVVFIREAHVAANVPDELDGVPVQTVVTGPIQAQ